MELGSTEKRILLIEDDKDIRSSIAEILESEGFPTDCADNGEEALIRLRAPGVKPSLILLDLRLPVKDGFQFRAEQSSDPAICDIPVIIISADGKLKEKTERIGAIGLLKKPVDIEDLLSAVRENLH